MEKTKTLAKRILSVALATMIVLSFALISVSAIPADYTQVGTNGEFIDFENGQKPHLSPENGNVHTLAVSDEIAHSGTKSLKVTTTSNYSKFYYSNGVKFEPNSAYYVSFWYYVDAGWGTSFAGTDMASGMTLSTVNYSSTTNGQWNKAWFTITTGDSVGGQWFRTCFYNTNSTYPVYVDDFEVRQVESATGLINTIPEGTTAEKIALAYGENVDLTIDQLANGTNSGDTVERTVEYAHWSEQSYKFVAKTASSTGDTGIYTSLNNSKFFGSGATLKANTPYYISYYVYCPTKPVSTMFNYFSVGGSIINQSIPQGQWTKVSALFVPDEATATAANSHLLRLWIRDTKDADGVNHPVYLDDLVIAELTEAPAAAAFTAGDAEYGVAARTAKLTINSTLELKALGTVTVEGATVDSAELSADKKSIELSLSGLTAETDYTATIENSMDLYGRTIESATATFTTPTAAECDMEFASTSIPDGYGAVYAPVDAIYFTVPYDLDPATVIPANFTIEGYKATVTAVELLSAKEVKVSVSGIYPWEDYKLSVDNVANTSGGILKDTLSFTTTTAGGQSRANFADGKMPAFIAVSASENGGATVVTDFGHGDNTSLRLDGITSGNYNFTKVQFGHMYNSRSYLVSFWYYSDTWSGNTAGTTYVDLGDWTFSSKTKGQWNKITIPVTTWSNTSAMNMSFWGVGAGQTVYIDDVKVIEIYTDIGSPVIKSGDAYKANSVGAGTTVITIPVTGDATAIQGYAAQYDENGKMLRVAMGTSTANAINITIENGEEVRTKIFLWDATTDVPVSNGFKYNYNVN